ncbi:MAG: 16S rRNA (guanine(527)-N(7))-methyltransferase RsmG [Legionellales bacterium]|nr:16S rRNA (guanine(527)-N(7))-methyltransferase RsmG [Legionellales bacterium]
MNELAQQLSQGIDALGLAVTTTQQQQLLDYIHLLAKWNKAYNLTAVRHIGDMVGRHLLDSLSIIPYLAGGRLIDVGTGPGLPGIPLAIVFADKTFTLLDSNGKKTRFLTQAVTELGLDNVQIINARVEEFKPEQTYDTVVSRAFSDLKDMVEKTQHLCAEDGQFLAMKGKYPADEIQALPETVIVTAVHPLRVPTVTGERHAVVIKNP